MLNNAAIQAKIRKLGIKIGLNSDNAICAHCKFSNRVILNDLARLKTSPRLDTLAKFAEGLGCSIEDLIYDRTDADMDLSRQIRQLSEYEKVKAVVYMETMLRERAAEKNKKAA